MNRRFLWGSDVASKPHLVNWSTVCLPRDYGGLGLRWSVSSGQRIKLWQDVWVGDTPLLEHAASELLPKSIVEKVLATLISAFGRQHDKVFWNGSSTDLHAWLKHNAERSLASGAPFPSWNIYFLSAIWTIWKSRNAVIFYGKKIPPHALQQHIYRLAIDTSMALTSNVLAPCRVPRWVRWYPPDFPFLKLNTDGAMNHTTGRAITDGLIRDHGGQWIHGFTVNIGPQSSFMAELWPCRAGLQLASMLGVTHLTLEMDSLMAIRLI
ncbi:hypothetical protein SLEP1_g4283 [Rubroshorea leprosula]|uniref:RNase H type-1 domain-containing protein n=1 Tax=Rubroshorea leprosula TaxID=152421 RepID=A0AAV5HWD3_9ROSI|nr:hypothetical protein SLEP1_g4283 [Rubroshorea leprosula]